MRGNAEKKYTLFGNVRYIYKTLYEVKPAMRFGMYGSIFFYLARASRKKEGQGTI